MNYCVGPSVTFGGMSDERDEFSKRLRAAMRAAGHEPRPSVLFVLFNARYGGRSVSFQAVSRWLNGKSIPEQDKLQVLAGLLGVEPHILRYGDKSKVGEGRAAWPDAFSAQDRSMIDAYLTLPAAQRKLVWELILVLASVAPSHGPQRGG